MIQLKPAEKVIKQIPDSIPVGFTVSNPFKTPLERVGIIVSSTKYPGSTLVFCLRDDQVDKVATGLLFGGLDRELRVNADAGNGPLANGLSHVSCEIVVAGRAGLRAPIQMPGLAGLRQASRRIRLDGDPRLLHSSDLSGVPWPRGLSNTRETHPDHGQQTWIKGPSVSARASLLALSNWKSHRWQAQNMAARISIKNMPMGIALLVPGCFGEGSNILAGKKAVISLATLHVFAD